MNDMNDEFEPAELPDEGQEPAIEPASDAAEAPERPWTDDEEFEARALGWRAPDEIEGKPWPGMIDDPRRFLERAEEFGPFRKLRERQEQQAREMQEQLRRIEAATSAAVERQRKADLAAYQREIERIRAEKRQAVNEADTERYERLEREERGIRPPEPERSAAPQGDPFEPFMDGRPWLANVAIQDEIAAIVDAGLKRGAIRSDKPNDQFEFAESQLKLKYPHLFQSSEQEKPKAKPSPVDPGGLGVKAKSGFDALPAVAKEAFANFVKQGVFKDTAADRQTYYEDYNNG